MLHSLNSAYQEYVSTWLIFSVLQPSGTNRQIGLTERGVYPTQSHRCIQLWRTLGRSGSVEETERWFVGIFTRLCGCDKVILGRSGQVNGVCKIDSPMYLTDLGILLFMFKTCSYSYLPFAKLILYYDTFGVVFNKKALSRWTNF